MTRVNGKTSERGVAGVFRGHFCRVYSGHDSPSHGALKNRFLTKFDEYSNAHANDSISPFYISWSDMEELMGKLKLGKSSSGVIRPEHIFLGSTKLVLHVQLIFNPNSHGL